MNPVPCHVLDDWALLVAAYRRTNLTMRQLARLFGVSKSAAVVGMAVGLLAMLST